MTRKQEPKVSNRLVKLDPMELFKIQVRNNYDNMRYMRKDMSYSPSQFGGLQGQRILLTVPSTMELIEFEVT